VVLILDKDLQLLPWESIPLLNRHSVSRLPSIDTLRWLLRLSKSNAYVSVDFRNAAYVINPKVGSSGVVSSDNKLLREARGRSQCFCTFYLNQL